MITQDNYASNTQNYHFALAGSKNSILRRNYGVNCGRVPTGPHAGEVAAWAQNGIYAWNTVDCLIENNKIANAYTVHNIQNNTPRANWTVRRNDMSIRFYTNITVQGNTYLLNDGSYGTGAFEWGIPGSTAAVPTYEQSMVPYYTWRLMMVAKGWQEGPIQ